MIVVILLISVTEIKVGGGVLSKKYFAKLGGASYEMYMIHAIMISFFQHGFDNYSEGRVGVQIILMIVCLLCTVSAGLYCHKLNNRLIKRLG
jgi:peptidoglycan/LPS O-acetylase OafA/YrhL